MKKLLLLTFFSAAALSSAGQKCDYDGFVKYAEMRLGHDELMKGAKSVHFSPEDTASSYHHVERKSVRKRTDGLFQANTYIFDGCGLAEIILERIDPFNSDTVSSARAFLRPDSSLQAICTDGHGMWKTNPLKRCAVVNDNCTCFNDFHKEKSTSVYGCMESHDYDRIEKKYGITRKLFCR